jgi:hypothetical protein
MEVSMYRRVMITLMYAALVAVPSDLRSQSVLRVGTFDSRAIAIAHARSAAFAKDLQQLHAEHKKAKEEKNDKLTAELEKKGQMQQKLMHLQAFSLGSVSEILARYPDLLPAVAKEQDVVLIVPQTEMAFRGAAVQVVDVTEALATKLNSDPRIAQMLKEIKDVKPLPMLDILLMKEEH